MDQAKIGRFIAELRKERKMTQSQLGEKLGVSYKAVSKWETGRNLPDPSLYKPLCDMLGITLTELFNGEEREIPSSVIGEKVMHYLKDLDQVAYVRFASIYREFKDVNTFMDELKKMLDK